MNKIRVLDLGKKLRFGSGFSKNGGESAKKCGKLGQNVENYWKKLENFEIFVEKPPLLWELST